MTTLNFFEPADNEAPGPEGYDETGCQCLPGDTQYLLEIEEGGIALVHAACGKQPPASWGDWHEFVTMDVPIPVTAQWEPKNCTSCRSLYEDCDHWVQVTAASVPKDVRTLTESEYNAAWHAVEGAAGEEGADPGTILHAVLDRLGIAFRGTEAPTAGQSLT